MKLTKKQLIEMLPGQTLTVACDTAGEWESAKRIAHKVRAEHRRDDGATYTVAQSVKDMTVSVTCDAAAVD